VLVDFIHLAIGYLADFFWKFVISQSDKKLRYRKEHSASRPSFILRDIFLGRKSIDG